MNVRQEIFETIEVLAVGAVGTVTLEMLHNILATCTGMAALAFTSIKALREFNRYRYERQNTQQKR